VDEHVVISGVLTEDAAFPYGASHVGTMLRTELAHRTHSDQECRSAIVIFGRFDHWL